ncbi:iron ABC transporter permease [Massilia sp. PAMC28688]|uniref:FecCD family ABC transporter permease n=1 Tax=Massilia sp. PAMC28688 TaxID=2861283 RepID=UPI001C625BE1|nr:iron ABC transporter permease [Massilia sp. PAMC28688]QYF95646.1 iron ABC transporter permease [Massilia sp. PAMC28688]
MMLLARVDGSLYALRARRWSLLVALRPLKVAAALLATLVLTCLLALGAGQGWVGPSQVAAALAGAAPAGVHMLVLELRLPRIAAGVAAGCALGLAGALVQAACRNRLATPDALGVADGATLGVFAGLILAGTGLMGPWWSGPAGAAVALALLLCAARIGANIQALLVIGIGVASLLRAVTEMLLSRQELMHASALYSWSVGSLTGRGYDAALPLALALLVLSAPALLVVRRLDLLRLGSDLACMLDAQVPRLQWLALALACMLAGLAVGACGPVAFVALAAPFVASRLAGAGRVAAGSAMLAGAVLVTGADTLGRIALDGAELPAGVVSNLLGGPFMLWLLLSPDAGESH